jgi:type II secretory pathway pseudopilin PulG
VSQLRHRDSGYILLTLLFFVAVLAVLAASMAPLITFQIKREREEEMIHRGVQYSRAVRRYFKKFGRYPTRIEDLESTNNLRFLRKRYKDPITGEDFKLLHYGDVKMFGAGGIAGAIPAGAAGQGPGAFGAQGGFGAQAGPGAGGFGPNRAGGAFSGFGPTGGVNQAPVGTANTNPATNSDPSAPVNAGSTGTGGVAGSGATGTPGDSSSTNNPSGNSSSSGSGSDSQNGSNTSNSNNSNNSNGPGGQVFGGGPIVGVASTSEKETIREFNKKHHYNDWQFIYDPNTDRGGLLNTPNQPPLQNTSTQPGQNGTNGMPGMPGAPGGFGQSPFGQPGQSGFGQPTPQPPSQPTPPPGSNN